MAKHTKAVEAPGTVVTANDRFKNRFGEIFWSGIALAALLHGAAFAFFPEIAASDVSFTMAELQAVDLPPDVDIPPPPEAIRRPATPVVGSADISEEITIVPTTFEENPVTNLPPPPTTGGAVEEDIGKAPIFTPYTVPPRLTNESDVARSLERTYPPLLRDAGIGGDVIMWFFIDEEGKVINTKVKESSGYQALDDAAVKVAQLMVFTPAFNRDKKVKVWVSIPIKFNTK